MLYAFVRVVIEVLEPGDPVFRERVVFDRVAVILGGDVAVAVAWGGRVNVLAGLVLGAVAEFQFVCFCAGGEGEDLVAHADSEDRFFEGQGAADDVVECGEDGRIARAV